MITGCTFLWDGVPDADQDRDLIANGITWWRLINHGNEAKCKPDGTGAEFRYLDGAYKSLSAVPRKTLDVFHFLPEALRTTPSASGWYTVKDWAAFRTYVWQFLTAVAKYKNEIWVEFGNEFWAMSPVYGTENPWTDRSELQSRDDPRRYADYLTTFGQFSAACAQWERQNPGFVVKVGGPSANFRYMDVPRFYSDCMGSGYRLDFISFHFYESGFAEMRAALKAVRDLTDLPVLSTESGLTGFVNPQLDNSPLHSEWLLNFVAICHEFNVQAFFLLPYQHSQGLKETGRDYWILKDRFKAFADTRSMVAHRLLRRLMTGEFDFGTLADTDEVGVV